MTAEKIDNSCITSMRTMMREDLYRVAKVHRLAFPDSMLTKIGKGAVKRYYEWQLEGPHDHYCIVSETGEEMTGFCVGGVSRGALGGFLRKYILYLTVSAVLHPVIVINKNFFKRARTAVKTLVKTVRRSNREELGRVRSEGNSFGILAICVIPSAKGSGIARMMMEKSEEEAVSRGFQRMHLTVASDNARAIRFYEKLGYIIRKSESPTGSTYMEKELK